MAADLRLGAGRFFAAVAGLTRSRRLLGLLAVLAIVQGPLTRYYSGGYSWWLLSSPHGQAHALNVGATRLADMLVRPIADPLMLLSDRLAAAVSMLMGVVRESYATAPWLPALGLAVVWALVHALVVVVVYTWLRSHLRSEPLDFASLGLFLRRALPALFGFELLLILPGQALSLSREGWSALLLWYVLRASLALTPFVIVGLGTGLRWGIVLGLRAVRARWASVLGAWVAYLAASALVGLVFWGALAGANHYTPGLFPQWPAFAALTIVWSFLAGWLAFAVCAAFMEAALQADSPERLAGPVPAPNAGVSA